MSARPTVILLHGLARTHLSMARLRRFLKRAGYPTWSMTYPSRRLPIAAIADEVANRIQRELPAGTPLAAVTHSLGGIVVRHMSPRITFARVVMLAPPNCGSRVAQVLSRWRFFRWFLGPAGREVGTPDLVRDWPAPSGPCAVIAATRTTAVWNPMRWFVRGVDRFAPDEHTDGTVAECETRLPGCAYTAVDTTHTFIMNNRRVRELILRFLETGTLDDAG